MTVMKLYLDGQQMTLTPAPWLKDGEVLVPLHAFSEVVGAEAKTLPGSEQVAVCNYVLAQFLYVISLRANRSRIANQFFEGFVAIRLPPFFDGSRRENVALAQPFEENIVCPHHASRSFCESVGG